jgi:hypothetical protein
MVAAVLVANVYILHMHYYELKIESVDTLLAAKLENGTGEV